MGERTLTFVGARSPIESTGGLSATAPTDAADSGSQPQASPIRAAGELNGDRTQTPTQPHSTAGWLRSMETPAERLARRTAWARYWNDIHTEAKRRNETGYYGPYGK